MEYQLHPSPIRADYLGSQRLNPIQQMSYFKRIFSSRASKISAPGTTITSVFDIYSADTDHVIYGGAALLSAGSSSRMIFPENLFQAGNLLRLVISGEISITAAAKKLNILHHSIFPEEGSLSINETTQSTDGTIGAGDLSNFQVEVFHQFYPSTATAGYLTPSSVSHLRYMNANSIEGFTYNIAPITSDDFDPTTRTFTTTRFNFSVNGASEDNVRFDSIYMELG